jgi:predicted acyltransferase (DUF342 family)
LSFGFILFSAAFCVWCLFHLVAVRWALAKLKNNLPDEIDMNFVRNDDFKPREVREGRRSDAAHFPGDAVLPEGSVAGATVADGALTLLSGVHVIGFIDSRGEMKIGENCVVEGRVTSSTAIRLGAGARVGTCYAPEITVGCCAARKEIVSSETTGAPPLIIPECSLRGQMQQLCADTWLFTGDLELERPVVLRAKLIVRGSFSAGAASELIEDLKVTGNLSIGPGSVCRGTIVSGGTITLGAGCHFERVLQATGDLHLGPKVHGKGTAAVVAYAAGRIFLSHGIVIQGKIASELEVVSLP